ncbi:hypothetical protein OG455_41700 [Kitasatospora sp. NBC_01287]|uniref:hypothetical protein n=1 Tax=Kitasatospora sp. NBC_01287 TaxID=2903573 RepID=UPI002255DF5B|nr:hypothetical protein [Kitasatospora sp. NBC_01287]MCX4751749.1 hypothetical protein [Kitasatospora sp. NBC_01287]MCX4751959.1 hypothetical protein [Kitasatospora sp. NBC_01287]
MTPAGWSLCCAASVLIAAGCIRQAARSDRAREERDVVTGAENLCRAAASGLFAINPEEN